jgi:hypothetical protein
VASVRGRSIQFRLWLAFAVGCTLGGAFTGTALGVLSGLVSPVPAGWRLVLLGVAATVLVVLDLRQPTLRLPQRHELIPQEVFARGLGRGGLRFGIEYGCGFRTLIPSAASYVAAGFVLLTALPLPWASALGAAFGASRSLAVLQYLTVGRPGWQQFLSGHSRTLERWGSVVAAVMLLTAAVPLLAR